MNVLEVAKTLISDKQFKIEFASCQKMFTPEVGDDGLVPTLAAYYIEDSDKYSVDVFAIDHDGFNDFDTRCHLLKSIGREMADNRKKLAAIFFISEAWATKHLQSEPIKYAKAGDDPNRQEVFILMGRTLDGRNGYSMTPFVREPGGKKPITAIQPTTTSFSLLNVYDNPQKSPLLDSLIYEYLKLMVARINSEKA